MIHMRLLELAHEWSMTRRISELSAGEKEKSCKKRAELRAGHLPACVLDFPAPPGDTRRDASISEIHGKEVPMSTGKKVKVGVVGLGFGAEFVPLYQKHPDAECYAICQRNEDKLKKVGDMFKVERRFTRFEDLLKVKEIDAIHVVTPIAAHAPMTIAALEAGKHACSTVPMATTVKECLKVAEARRKSGKVYMMMETAVYTREFLFVKEMADKGELGKIQFLRGSHQQNMSLPGLARLLVRLSPHALRHARGEPAALSGRRGGGIRGVLRLGHHPRGVREEVRLALRHRDGAHEAPRWPTADSSRMPPFIRSTLTRTTSSPTPRPDSSVT